MIFEDTTSNITGLDLDAMKKAREHLDSLTKPQGSLGRLEDLCIQIAGIQGSKPSIERKKIFVLAGDHGVTQEGVSAYPSSVTLQMVRNMANGGAAINALSGCAGAELEIVDTGMEEEINLDSVVDRKVDNGTNNFYKEPAMTLEQAENAVKHGIDLIQDFASDQDVIGLGEMGIGNTTTTAAVLSTLLELEPEEVTGRGTGLEDEQVEKKARVIEDSLEKHTPFNNPLDILSKVGGFEIAGLTGLILGGAAENKVMVVDGYIPAAAALLAIEIESKVENYLVFANKSAENGADKIIEHLETEPLLNLDMKLGEGTGAALALNIIDAAVEAFHGMATFEEAGVSQD